MANEDGTIKTKPALVLEVRQIPRKNVRVVQWFIQWENQAPEDATWEDAEFIKHTFPTFFRNTIETWRTANTMP